MVHLCNTRPQAMCAGVGLITAALVAEHSVRVLRACARTTAEDMRVAWWRMWDLELAGWVLYEVRSDACLRRVDLCRVMRAERRGGDMAPEASTRATVTWLCLLARASV